jgi:hypothetical protein
MDKFIEQATSAAGKAFDKTKDVTGKAADAAVSGAKAAGAKVADVTADTAKTIGKKSSAAAKAAVDAAKKA